MSNLNVRDANINDNIVGSHEKLMTGGIWAIIDVEYDPSQTIGSKIYPFCGQQDTSYPVIKF